MPLREFISAQLKLDRANHHIADLDARREVFLTTRPCKIRTQYNSQTSHTDYIVEDVAEVDPAISLVIGDAIHNLRAALDHLAASLVRDNGAPVLSSTYFPICQSPAKYIAQAPGKIQGMSIADQKRIGFLKPYLGGNNYLWGLHKMDIADKHSLILTHTQCVGGINYRVSDADVARVMGPGFFGASPSTEKKPVSIPLIGPLPVPKKGNVVISMLGNTEKDEDMQPAFDIAFGDVEVFEGRLVLPSVRELADLVQSIINAFA